MSLADSTEAIKTKPDETVDTYVWKPEQARSPKPAAIPAPYRRVSSSTPWSRTWRIFAAGLIMGVAATKAAELLLHSGGKRTRGRFVHPEPPMD
ncbi:hypothetical protein ABI_10720 [Asticcacaulis biprosthecium C19]|uniref:Uncharacterized protein n=1 Tax=Asticcacaulis biprosthecium C19 TaxID=715226 RepID=F4QH98_9CAUL|nr:hypothetical protein [Asticcacaulis biprosthecium]EGF92635.1 hypothetical protein ABI_10720 [Asticcacaulis biprosthecium C19]